jgi:hypothetical protein
MKRWFWITILFAALAWRGRDGVRAQTQLDPRTQIRYGELAVKKLYVGMKENNVTPTLWSAATVEPVNTIDAETGMIFDAAIYISPLTGKLTILHKSGVKVQLEP